MSFLLMHLMCLSQTPASTNTRDGSSYDIATNSTLGLHNLGSPATYSYDEFDGSPFFYDEFVLGNARFANGLFQDSIQLKYDLATYTFLSKHDDETEFAINSKSVAEYRLFINDKEYLFKRVDPKFPTIFYEILYEGDKITLYKSETVKVVKGQELGITSSKNRFFREAKYYIRKGIEIRRIKLKKKDLWYYLSDQEKDKLDAYMKIHKVKLKKDQDFKKLLSILNTEEPN